MTTNHSFSLSGLEEKEKKKKKMKMRTKNKQISKGDIGFELEELRDTRRESFLDGNVEGSAPLGVLDVGVSTEDLDEGSDSVVGVMEGGSVNGSKTTDISLLEEVRHLEGRHVVPEGVDKVCVVDLRRVMQRRLFVDILAVHRQFYIEQVLL